MLLFFLLLIFIITTGIGTANFFVLRNHFSNWETEANLFLIKNHQQKDIVTIGISHARNLSRHKNHLRFEQITGKSMINLGRGGNLSGLGIQYLYLHYFYEKKNTASTLLFVLTPTLMYADTVDGASNAFCDEPLKMDFIRLLLEEGSKNKQQQLFYYIKSKLSPSWLFTRPYSDDRMNDYLKEKDSAAISAGMKLAYLQGVDRKTFEQSKKTVRQIIELATAHHTKIIIMIPPALFGKWKGHSETVEMLKELQKIYPLQWYDYSESITEPHLYYDQHHLNTDGVILFTKNYLRDILH